MNMFEKISSLIIQKVSAQSLGDELQGQINQTTKSSGTEELINNIMSLAVPLSVVCVVCTSCLCRVSFDV